MKSSRTLGSPTTIDSDAHRRLREQLNDLVNAKGTLDPRQIIGVVHSLFRELEAVERRLNLLPEGPSLNRWFWRPMRQEAIPPAGGPQAFVFCLADTQTHVRDGQSLIALARHLSLGDAPAVQFEPIPVRAERQQVPKELQGIFPNVALLLGRPVLFGSLLRQYGLGEAMPHRFSFTQEDPDAADQALRDDHFGDVFPRRRFEIEGEQATEDYGLVRRFSYEDGPISRTFYVIAGLSSLGTYAATLCSLHLLEGLGRELASQPEDKSQLDVLVTATATHGEAVWNLDASSVRIVRAYLDDQLFQADQGTGWQAVPPRRIELVLREEPGEDGTLDIDHIVLERLQRETIPGQQQQARIIGCLVYRSLGDAPPGTSGTDLAEQKWIWQDRGRGRKLSPSEAISKMLNVARRHLGSALVSKDNRYVVRVPGEIAVSQAATA